MHHPTSLQPEDLEALRRIDACTLSNAIELLDIRPRNEGYIRDTIQCMFRKLPPIAGYAVTGRMRAASPPVEGHCYYEHLEWWRYVASVPPPRIVVLLDADDPPGAGALFGELHARICVELHCVGYITNGRVRDLPAIERLGFQLFANGTSVSHAYAHVVDYGCPVEIGGLRIHSGDLLHGDLHGVQSVPHEVATKLPEVAAKVLHDEQAFINMCVDGSFSIERLAERVKKHVEGRKCR